MSAEDNKAIQRQWLDALNSGFESGVMDRADAIVAPNFIAYEAAAPGPLDWSAHQQYTKVFFTAFPDGHLTVEDLVAEGAMVVARWIFHGTHRGTLMGVPPTGKAVSMRGIEINRIVDGQIEEHWVSMDVLGLLQQVGAIPTSDQATA